MDLIRPTVSVFSEFREWRAGPSDHHEELNLGFLGSKDRESFWRDCTFVDVFLGASGRTVTEIVRVI